MANLNKLVLTFLIFCLSGFAAFSQTGNVEIDADYRLDILVNQKRIKADTSDISGYRVQLYFGTNMEEAQKVAKEIKKKFPEYAEQVYIEYKQPYWRVRVGNFYRAIDAQRDMHILKDEFGDVFLVKDMIELPNLNTKANKEDQGLNEDNFIRE